MKLIMPDDIARFKNRKEYQDLKAYYGMGCRKLEDSVYSISLPVILVFYESDDKIKCEAVAIPVQKEKIVKDSNFVTFVYEENRYVNVPKFKD